MDDEVKLHSEIHRAQRAKDILENEIYQEALQTLEQRLITAWRSSPLRDIDGQHELRLTIGLLDSLKGYFNQTFTTGELAKKQLEQLTKTKKSIFNF